MSLKTGIYISTVASIVATTMLIAQTTYAAACIYENTSETTTYGFGRTSAGDPPRGQLGQTFTTGALGCELDTVTFKVSKESGASDGLQVAIYSSNAGIPDAELATSTTVAASAIANNFGSEATETATIAVTLEAETEYVFVLRRTGSYDNTNNYYAKGGTGGDNGIYFVQSGNWAHDLGNNLVFSVSGTEVEDAGGGEETLATTTATSTTPVANMHFQTWSTFYYVITVAVGLYFVLSVIRLFRRKPR